MSATTRGQPTTGRNGTSVSAHTAAGRSPMPRAMAINSATSSSAPHTRHTVLDPGGLRRRPARVLRLRRNAGIRRGWSCTRPRPRGGWGAEVLQILAKCHISAGRVWRGVGGGLHRSAPKTAVAGGFTLAEEYSAFVVGEFETVAALHAGEGRLLPLHGQDGASQSSRAMWWMSCRDSASLNDERSAMSSSIRYLFSRTSAPR